MAKDMYILIGVPGSGKSTWVEKEFQGECTHLGSDVIIEAIAKENGQTYDETFTKYAKIADRMMMEEFDKSVGYGCTPIIIDRTNMSIKSRARFFDRLRVFYKDHGYKIHAVVFPKPNDKEHKRRLNNRPGKTIPSKVIDSMLASFQMPSLAEGFDTIKIVS